MSAACHPAHPAPPAPSAPSSLRHDIDAILADPPLARGYWGVVVRSLKTGETLYDLNARKLMIPASNMKIVTLAAAAQRLGWDYSYATVLMALGPIADGTLHGDLNVVGTGDPSLMSDGTAPALFAEWADSLKRLGVRTISGRIVGDDNMFDDEALGFGWSWDDLPDDYAAGVGALQLNENAVRVTIAPGPAIDDSAAVGVEPAGGLTVDNGVRTVGRGSATSIVTHRLPGRSRLEVRGTIEVGASPVVRGVAVDNPTLFFVTALRAALIAHGIHVDGPAMDIDDVTDSPAASPEAPGAVTRVAVHRAPPLSTLAIRLMKASQNQYAETLLKTLGALAGMPTSAGGCVAVQDVLAPWGVASADVIQRDGSGLSRYDYVTPDALATILTHVDRDDRLRGPFEASLPIAGRDGSLSNRMKGTSAEGNVRAKTGSMSNVRSLSGYATAADGEPLVFAIIANNFDAAPSVINTATDAIVVRLTKFTR